MQNRIVVPFSQALRAVAAPCLVSRAGVLLVGLAAAIAARDAPPPNSHSLWRVSADPVRNMLARWDTYWYFDIATRGYSWNGNPLEQQNVVFFPLLPALMRFGGRAIGGHPLLAGLAVSLVAFPAALAYVWRWTAERHGRDAASWTVALLCAFPFSVFFSAVYTESLFLLVTMGAWYHCERRDTVPSALFGFAAGLVRPNGFMLAAPLAWLLFEDRDRRPSMLAGCAIVAAPVLGVLAVSSALAIRVGDPWAWIRGQAAWPTYAFWGGRGQIDPGPPWPFDPWSVAVNVGNGITAAAAAISIRAVVRRVSLAGAIWMVLCLLLPFARHGLLSLGRFTSVLFPFFVCLALGPTTSRRWLIVAFGISQIVAAILFFTWRPLV
jgi:Mannosyltransferase (PIG-V)